MTNEVMKANGKGGALVDPAKVNATLANMRKSGTPRVEFLKMDKTGEWVHGQDEEPLDPEDRVYVDPNGFVHGWQCWADTDIEGVSSALLGSELVGMHEPLPERPSKVPENGRPWGESVGMSCLIDGVPMKYTTNSVGGRNAIAKLGDEYMKQYARDPSKMIAVLTLSSEWYKHKNKTYGKIFTPVFTVVEWVDALPAEATQGAVAAPAPEPVKAPAKKAAKASRKGS